MKKLAIAGFAALIAATSFAATADAGQRWRHGGWHGGHHAGWRAGVWFGGPRVVIGGPTVVIGGNCVVKKKINRYGEVVRKRICY